MRRYDPLSPDFTFKRSPLYWLTRAANLYTETLGERLKAIGMDVPRWRVLMILAEQEPASITELSDHAVVKLATMAKVVQRMADEGLVAVRPRASDARVTEAVLTDRGRAALADVRATASGLFGQAYAGLTDADIETMNALLGRVMAGIRTR